MQNSVEAPQKVGYDPAIPLLGIHRYTEIIQKDTCTPMFTAELSHIGTLIYSGLATPALDDDHFELGEMILFLR